jgi:hypothetical protein
VTGIGEERQRSEREAANYFDDEEARVDTESKPQRALLSGPLSRKMMATVVVRSLHRTSTRRPSLIDPCYRQTIDHRVNVGRPMQALRSNLRRGSAD